MFAFGALPVILLGASLGAWPLPRTGWHGRVVGCGLDSRHCCLSLARAHRAIRLIVVRLTEGIRTQGATIQRARICESLMRVPWTPLASSAVNVSLLRSLTRI